MPPLGAGSPFCEELGGGRQGASIPGHHGPGVSGLQPTGLGWCKESRTVDSQPLHHGRLISEPQIEGRAAMSQSLQQHFRQPLRHVRSHPDATMREPLDPTKPGGWLNSLIFPKASLSGHCQGGSHQQEVFPLSALPLGPQRVTYSAPAHKLGSWDRKMTTTWDLFPAS